MNAGRTRQKRRLRRILGGAVSACVTLGTAAAVSTVVITAAAGAANATTALPATVSADALPTWQIDGVVWDQVTVGDTVYATGQFNYARPPGTAAGAPSELARENLVAYNITTGVVTSFDIGMNGAGLALAATPDGTKLFVGGAFTTIHGVSQPYIAELDLSAGGTLVTTFKPALNTKVRALVATNSTVYAGGDFTTVNGNAAGHLAAFSVSTGAQVAWPATVNDQVEALTLSSDLSTVVIGGRFTTLDAATRYGIGTVSASTGALGPWSSSFPVKDTGSGASVTSLTTSGSTVYGTSYNYSSTYNYEGRFAMNPLNGTLVWMDSCHGDAYSSVAVGSVLYTASHSHDCSDDSSFDQTGTPQRAIAETTTATGVLAHNNDTTNKVPYSDYAGQPANTILPWFPTLTPGTFTGQEQAAWSVTGNSSYVAFGGEFPSVNGVAQQGLVRFAVRSIAPDKVGPVSSTASTPIATSNYTGSVLVKWAGTYDLDDPSLTYAVYRDGSTTALKTITAQSSFYAIPQLSFLDTGLTAGSSHTYRIGIKDPDGNGFTTAASTAVTVKSTGTRLSYENLVLADGAMNFWPLSDASGTTVADSIGGNNITLGSSSSVTRGVTGPPVTGGGKATTFNGTSTAAGQSVGSGQPFTAISIEAWIKTTGAGQIVDLGSSRGRASAITNDTLYLSSAGKAVFTVWTPTGYQSLVSTTAVNDGAWHMLTGTLWSGGATLYVDGKRVATNTSLTTIRQLLGPWKIGGDAATYLPSPPASAFFNGTIADVAVYPKALTSTQAYNHFAE